jgi:Holliday junction resolvase RusA-like endonuclease
MSTELISLFVPGHPRTKGSLRPEVDWARRKVRMVEQVEQSKPWRQKMQAYIVRKVREQERPGKWEPYAGPLSVGVVFAYERPRTGVGVDLPYPIIEAGENANGDVDKLLRNLLDALQGSGLIKNDAQVCETTAAKMWETDAIPAGAHIVVHTL